MNEAEKIKSTYEERAANAKLKKYYSNNAFTAHIVREREKVYKKIIERTFSDPPSLKFMEIGAGNGNNLPFFHSLGIRYENMSANELTPDRFEALKSNFPNINTFPGNAAELNFTNQFDIVFQSTVFTSILSTELKKELADKMWNMLRPGGIVLWYDFTVMFSRSDYIRHVPKKAIRSLFNKAKRSDFHRVTLAPPIARRIGNFYPFINFLFPFLRTHTVAVIYK